ncbi:hypothetical protein FM112_16225 [Gulosibacter sp. 10]|nr:hypothetical protein FM112_16225 [Gulosibacter sp. 10]
MRSISFTSFAPVGAPAVLVAESGPPRLRPRAALRARGGAVDRVLSSIRVSIRIGIRCCPPPHREFPLGAALPARPSAR